MGIVDCKNVQVAMSAVAVLKFDFNPINGMLSRLLITMSLIWMDGCMRTSVRGREPSLRERCKKKGKKTNKC